MASHKEKAPTTEEAWLAAAKAAGVASSKINTENSVNSSSKISHSHFLMLRVLKERDEEAKDVKVFEPFIHGDFMAKAANALNGTPMSESLRTRPRTKKRKQPAKQQMANADQEWKVFLEKLSQSLT